MDITENIFLSMLSCHLNGKNSNELDFSNIDIEKFKHLAKIHRLGGITYSCIKDTDIDKDTISYFELAFLTELSMFTMRSKVIDLLVRMLDKEKVDYVFVKGGHIAQMYPVEELRTMSDLDLLIREVDKEKVKELFLANGATYVEEHSKDEVNVFKINLINIEVHTNLVEDDILMHNYDYRDYFARYINCGCTDERNKKVLKTDELVIYTIFHIAKHFYNMGCGIRMLMDLVVIVNKCTDINWDYVYVELKRLRIDEFADCMFAICSKWFESDKLPNRTKYSEEFHVVEKFIIAGGVYGFSGANPSAYKVSNFGRKENGTNYFIGMLRWAFPSISEMRKYSPWFASKPVVLLPVAYVERFVRNARERGGAIKWVKNIIKGKKDLDERQLILSTVKLR